MKIKLITGMFKMESCDISVSNDTVVIASPEKKRRILLSDIENISVTRHNGRNTRFEISLGNELIEGMFAEKSDADEFTTILRECKGSVLQIDFHGQ